MTACEMDILNDLLKIALESTRNEKQFCKRNKRNRKKTWMGKYKNGLNEYFYF